MGKVWDDKILPLGGYPHRNAEKQSEEWEAMRLQELEKRASRGSLNSIEDAKIK